MLSKIGNRSADGAAGRRMRWLAPVIVVGLVVAVGAQRFGASARGAKSEAWVGSAPEQSAAPAAVQMQVVSHLGGAIGGAGLVGNHIFIAQGALLKTVDTTTPNLDTVALLAFPQEISRVAVQGNVAVVLSTQGPTLTLEVADLTNPLAPVRRGRVTIVIPNPYAEVTAAHIAAGRAYVTTNAGLRVFDISNASAPTYLGSYGTTRFAGVAVSGQYAYVGDVNGGKLSVLNVNNPAAITVAGSLALVNPAAVCIVGQYAYVAGRALTIVNIAVPAAPAKLGSYTGPLGLTHVAVFNNRAYVADATERLTIVNVATPASPSRLGDLTIPGGGWVRWIGAGLVGSAPYAYVAIGANEDGNGLVMVNCNAPAAPVIAKRYLTPWESRAIFASGSDLFLSDGSNVWRYNPSNPAQPNLVGFFPVADATAVYVDAGLAYVGAFTDSLHIYDLTNPLSPTLRSTYHALGQVLKLRRQGRYAYLITNHIGAFEIVDLQDPAHPTRAGSLPIEYATMDLWLLPSDNLAYVLYYHGDDDQGLKVINVANPAAPVEVRSVQTSDWPVSIWVEGNTAYVGGANRDSKPWFVQAFDIAARTNPVSRAIGTGTGSRLAGLAVRNDVLWGSLPNGSLYAWDTAQWATPSASFAPTTLGRLEIPDSINSVFIETGGASPANGDWTTVAVVQSGQQSTSSSGVYISGTGGEWITISQPVRPRTPTPAPSTTATSTPTPVASAAKSAVPATGVYCGQVISYTVMMTWHSYTGEGAASSMHDPIPQYTEYVQGSARTSLGAVSFGQGTINWAGNIPDGATAFVYFTVRVKCEELMGLERTKWPAKISNAAAGNIGPIGFTAARDVPLFQTDLQISGFEVTQVIQRLASDEVLIPGKDTYARVFAKGVCLSGTKCPDVTGVTAKLTRLGGGGLAAGNELNPITGPTIVQVMPGQDRPTRDERATLAMAWLFRLPLDWTNSTSDLRAEINPECTRPDGDCENNTSDLHVYIPPRQSFKVALIPFDLPGGTPPSNIVALAAKGLRRFPIAETDIRLYYERPLTPRNACGATAANGYLVTGRCLIETLDANRVWSFIEDKRIYYVGVVGADVNTGNLGGQGWQPGRTSWTAMLTSAEWTGATLAHELGHNFGLEHVDCPVGVPANCGAYPYNTCELADGTAIGYWGIDTERYPGQTLPLLYDPRENADMMTYAHLLVPPRWMWISDDKYSELWLAIGRLGAQQEALGAQQEALGLESDESLAAAEGERLAINMYLQLGGSQGTIDSIYRFTNPNYQEDNAPGPYSLELQNASAQVLASRTFSVPVLDAAVGTDVLVVHTLPYNTLGRRVVLKHGATVLDAVAASANPPTVTLSAPRAGITVSGPLTITWTARDLDADALTHVVQYSADNGATWEPLAVGITRTTHVVDAALLPGGPQCLVRVTTSDGFYTGVATSGAFGVARKAPMVTILQPSDGATYPPGRIVPLRGQAYDQGYTDLVGASLEWRSDVGGLLGTGEALDRTDLAPGYHSISLRARDSAGLVTTDTVRILVGYASYVAAVER